MDEVGNSRVEVLDAQFDSVMQVTLPHELLKCVDTFTRFYESRTSHRKLKWIHTLGTSTVIGRFDPKPIELVQTCTM